MREVILHVGMAKTGSTSIQESLYNLNRDGFQTLRFAEKNHSIPMCTIFSKHRILPRKWKLRGYTDSQIDEKKAKYESILEEEIKKNESVNCFLLSGEGMSYLYESEQINLCEFFKERGLKVKVIIIVRDPVSLAASRSQQMIKSGVKKLTKINPNYRARILGFIKGCGQKNVSVLDFEKLIQGGLIKTFSEIIGVTLEDKGRFNESLSCEALAVIYALNNIKNTTFGSEINFKSRNTLIAAARNFFSESNGFKKLDLTKFDLVDEATAEELVWLQKNFGISYQLHDKADKSGLVYDEVPSEKSLSEFFGNYALEYQPSLSLADNLEDLYAKILRFSEIDLQVETLKKQDNWLDALTLSKKQIDLGDDRHSVYRRASNISHRLKKIDDAITFAKQAVNAKDNNDTSRANHKRYLANLLRIVGQLGNENE